MARPWESAFGDLHRQVDEMFEELVYRPWAITARPCWRPPLDIHETAGGYLVVLDLPDVKPDDLRVAVGSHELVVAGRRERAAHEDVLSERCERPCGNFERTLKFPQAVDPQQTHAELVRGTCRIYLPKQSGKASSEPGRRVLQLVVL